MTKYIYSCLFVLVFSLSATAMAQEGQHINAVNFKPKDERLAFFNERIDMTHPQIDLEQIPSLFFTPAEQSLITEARLGFMARPPTAAEIQQAKDGNVSVGPREVELAGIVYLSAGDWTIWLNGQKLTPKRLPPEILDIKVRKNSVKLKWFDAHTNQIFPIKLKTHQRFNIDTRIFLPG